MTAGEIAQVLTAVAAIGGVVVSLLNRRGIRQVHDTTNSKMDRLLDVTATAAKAEGVKEGKEEAGNT